MKNFTDKGIAALKPPAEGLAEYRDPALPGFGIRVSPKGTKTFFLARRVQREGKRVKSRISLGRYPTIKLKEVTCSL